MLYHWILYNIATTVNMLPENIKSPPGKVGVNSWGKKEYGGPCPPSGQHRYFFRLFAFPIYNISSSFLK